MSIEIRRARAIEGGRVVCEVEFPNLGSFSRGCNELLRIEAAAFKPGEVIGPFASQAEAEHEMRRWAAEAATGRRIPRASTPPFVQYPECSTLGGQPLIVGQDEPPLRACDFTGAEGTD